MYELTGSLAVYGFITGVGGGRGLQMRTGVEGGGEVESPPNSSDRTGVKFWHEDQFQFTSCRSHSSRTERKQTCIIVCMFEHTHTNKRRHVHTCIN